MKLCKDCKHAEPVKGLERIILGKWEFAKCKRDVKTVISPVHGLPMDDGTKGYCSVQRLYTCGPDAKHFVSKCGCALTGEDNSHD